MMIDAHVRAEHERRKEQWRDGWIVLKPAEEVEPLVRTLGFFQWEF